MKCEQCSNPIEGIPGTPSKFPELKRKTQGTPKKVDGPDGKTSWVVAFAAFMINFIMAGLSRMSGILYVAFIEMFKVDRKSASMPFSVRSSTMNLLGPVVGVLGQKYGVRKVSVIGGIVGTISAAACYFGDNILWLTILWGGLNGVGTALVTTLTTVIVGQYFDKYKTTAAGLTFSGACIGSFIFPPLIEWLLEIYGLSGSFLIVAGITMHCVPAAMILKKPSWVKRANRIKAVEATKETTKEKSASNHSGESDEDLVKKVDLNYLRENSELVVKLMTTDISAKDEKCVVFPPEDDILKEMEDVYSFIGKKPALPSSETSPDPRNDLDTTPVRSNDRNGRTNRLLSVDDNFHTPVRKVQSSYSVMESCRKSQCKPFITSKLSELYNKSENLIMSHVAEKTRYTKVLKELRMLHKVYEAVKKRKIFSQHSPLLKTPSKIVPKIQHLKKTATSSGIWNNIVNSIKLHFNPLFLLVSLCRAVHFSTFIPAITIIVDYAMDKGFREEDGIYVIAALSVGDLFGRLGLGWVTDRGFISLPKYMMLVMILQGMCTAGFPLLKRKATLLPLTCVYALLQGSVFVRHSVLISKYMKPEEQSIAQGCVNFFAGLSGFAVPYYVGFFRDTMGSYDWIFYINGAVGAAAGFLWIFEPFFVSLTNRPKEFPKADVEVV